MATQCSGISSKFAGIISKSTLISSGSPVIYELERKKEEKEGFTRITVGEEKLNKTNKTILLVGETGAGKSTLINAFFNYTLGVKFEDGVWFKVVEEEKISQMESQTSNVIVYEILECQSLPFSLTIIDTPGYGRTEGAEHDAIISQRLLKLFQSKDGVHELHAVGLVMRASDNRLNDRLRYIYDSVLSLFGKDLEKNIVALVTHSDGTQTENVLKALKTANIKCAANENEPVHFRFNNCQSDDRTDENDIKKLKKSFDETDKGMSQFEKFIGEAEAQRLGTTLEVLNTRYRLEACIHNLQKTNNLSVLKQEEIKQCEEGLNKYEEKIKSGEEFTIEIDEVYKEREEAGVGSWALGLFYDAVTICTECEENCHYPCTVAWNPTWCKVMKNGNCTVCTKNCPVSMHVKENERYVTKTQKVKKTLDDVKKKYEIRKEEISRGLIALRQERDELDKEENEFLEEAYQHVMKLEQIGLNGISLSTAVHLDVLIEKMMEKGEKEKIQELEKINNRQDKGVISVMKSFYRQLKG